MGEPPRPYVRLAADYQDDERFADVDPLAELLWVRGLCAARMARTDGYLTPSSFARAAFGIRSSSRRANALVVSGLWIPNGHGWQVPPDAWARWQTTQDQWRRARDDAAERQRRSRAKRRAE